jgi:uncharacterized phage protein (TIGR02218 family)
MTFSLFEISNRSGRPVFLYEFSWGAKVWRYTSADRDIEGFAGFDWTAIAISDEGVILGNGPQEFRITLPANLDLVGLFRSTPPAEAIKIRALRYHRDDLDEQVAVYWTGTIGNVKRKDRAKAMIFGLPTVLRRTGLRMCWERNCPHMLYDQDCKVDRDLFKVETTITALTGTSITLGSLGAWAGEQFNGGFIEWEADPAPAYDRRGIESYVAGNLFNLFGTTDRLVVDQDVTVYLGCDLTPETCDGTFDNLDNHGGYRFMPGKSPFDGDPVF